MTAEQTCNIARSRRFDIKVGSPPTPLQNHLLAALPAGEYGHLSSSLELTKMSSNEVLCDFSNKLRYAYFPTTAIISVLYITENCAPCKIAVIGNEGVVGIDILMGRGTTLTRGIVQRAGYAYRLSALRLQQEFSRNGSLMNLLLRYAQALVTQITYSEATIK